MNRPTLKEIEGWPSTVGVAQAATAFGISRSQGYALVDLGEFPARVIPVGKKKKVVSTASIIKALTETEAK